MTDFLTFEAERIRRLLLEGLAAQPSGSWTGAMLVKHLSTLGYRKHPDYVRNQLNWLADTALAVSLVPAGNDVVAKLRKAGRLHVEGVSLLTGVHAPDDED